MLRSKFADGETGSEVLRQRVTEEEARAGKLFSELAEARSHINSLDVELMRREKSTRPTMLQPKRLQSVCRRELSAQVRSRSDCLDRTRA